MTIEDFECKECNGTGSETPDCSKCDGNGWVDDSEDGGYMVCPECDDNNCPKCNGTGEL